MLSGHEGNIERMNFTDQVTPNLLIPTEEIQTTSESGRTNITPNLFRLGRQASANAEEEGKECGICNDLILAQIGHLRLNCRCLVHFNCLVRYIRSKSSQQIIQSEGIVCPYNILGTCSYSPGAYFIHPDDLEVLLEYQNSHGIQIPLPVGSSLSSPMSPNENMYLLPEDQQFTLEECRKIQGWLDDSKKKVAYDESLTTPYVEATTKVCPNCNFRVSHYVGHACHHIQGCPSCQTHWCYRCRCSETENSAQRGSRSSCKCGGWSNFCPGSDGVGLYLTPEFIQLTPYPIDTRCGCAVCPECRPGKACPICPGNCPVCRDIIQPGPTELTDAWVLMSPDQQSKFDTKRATEKGRELIGLISQKNIDRITKFLTTCSPVILNFQESSTSFSMNTKPSILTAAVESKVPAILSLILAQSGINVNLVHCSTHETALMRACVRGDLEMAQLLLQEPTCDQGIVNASNENFLHIAAQCSTLDSSQFEAFFNKLIQTSTIEIINAQDRNGFTVLAKLVHRENTSIGAVKALLDKREVSVNSMTTDHRSVLTLAIERKNTELILALLSRDDLDVDFMEKKNIFNKSPLETAASFGLDEASLAMLKRSRADMTKVDPAGMSLLMHCVLKGCHLSAEYLLTHPFAVDPYAVSKERKTPFMYACLCKSSSALAIVSKLLTLFTAGDRSEYTAEQSMKSNLVCPQNHELVKVSHETLSLDAVCNTCKGAFGFSFDILSVPRLFSKGQHFAAHCSKCSYNMCQSCATTDVKVESPTTPGKGKYAQLNWMDSSGKTALIYAIEQKSSMLVGYLLAQPEINPNIGVLPPLHYAIETKDDRFVKSLLLLRRDIVSSWHHKEFSPLLNACEFGLLRTIEILLRSQNGITASTGSNNPIISILKQFTSVPDSNKLAVVKSLITAGIDINQADKDGKSPLVYALLSRNWGLIQYFMSQPQLLFSSIDYNGATVLFPALQTFAALLDPDMTKDVKVSKEDVEKLLLKIVKSSSFDMNKADIQGDSAISKLFAEFSKSGSNAFHPIAPLKNSGLNISPSSHPSLQPASTSFSPPTSVSNTVTTSTSKLEYKQFIVSVLLKNASINLSNAKGNTQLLTLIFNKLCMEGSKSAFGAAGHSISADDVKFIKLLLETPGITVNVDSSATEGTIANPLLQLAARSKLPDDTHRQALFHALIDAGANVNQEVDGKRLFTYMLMERNVVMIERLLIHPAIDLNYTDSDGKSVFSLAIIYLGATADNTNSFDSSTKPELPDLIASIFNCVQKIVDFDFNKRDKNSMSALDYAAISSPSAFALLLNDSVKNQLSIEVSDLVPYMSGLNSCGAVTRPVYDNNHTNTMRHYCNEPTNKDGFHRYVPEGNGLFNRRECSNCDHRCGPSGGCQCVSCYTYSSSLPKNTSTNVIRNAIENCYRSRAQSGRSDQYDTTVATLLLYASKPRPVSEIDAEIAKACITEGTTILVDKAILVALLSQDIDLALYCCKMCQSIVPANQDKITLIGKSVVMMASLVCLLKVHKDNEIVLGKLLELVCSLTRTGAGPDTTVFSNLNVFHNMNICGVVIDILKSATPNGVTSHLPFALRFVRFTIIADSPFSSSINIQNKALAEQGLLQIICLMLAEFFHHVDVVYECIFVIRNMLGRKDFLDLLKGTAQGTSLFDTQTRPLVTELYFISSFVQIAYLDHNGIVETTRMIQGFIEDCFHIQHRFLATTIPDSAYAFLSEKFAKIISECVFPYVNDSDPIPSTRNGLFINAAGNHMRVSDEDGSYYCDKPSDCDCGECDGICGSKKSSCKCEACWVANQDAFYCRSEEGFLMKVAEVEDSTEQDYYCGQDECKLNDDFKQCDRCKQYSAIVNSKSMKTLCDIITNLDMVGTQSKAFADKFEQSGIFQLLSEIVMHPNSFPRDLRMSIRSKRIWNCIIHYDWRQGVRKTQLIPGQPTCPTGHCLTQIPLSSFYATDSFQTLDRKKCGDCKEDISCPFTLQVQGTTYSAAERNGDLAGLEVHFCEQCSYHLCLNCFRHVDDMNSGQHYICSGNQRSAATSMEMELSSYLERLTSIDVASLAAVQTAAP